MPRYYFQLSDGKQVLNNHKGIDLAGNAAAREDALLLARELINSTKKWRPNCRNYRASAAPRHSVTPSSPRLPWELEIANSLVTK